MNASQRKAVRVGVLNAGLMNAVDASDASDWERFWRCHDKIEAMGCEPIPYRRSEWPATKWGDREA
jgi:hypothetical protein